MAHADEGVAWPVDLEEAEPPARLQHAREFVQHRFDGREVPQREAGNRHREAGIGEGQPKRIALDPEPESGGAFVGCEEHSPREVEADGFGGAVAAVLREVAGAAGEVEHAVGGADIEAAHEVAAPALVRIEGHEPVDAVVAGRDPVEHRAHRGCFLFGAGKDAHSLAIVARGGLTRGGGADCRGKWRPVRRRAFAAIRAVRGATCWPGRSNWG